MQLFVLTKHCKIRVNSHVDMLTEIVPLIIWLLTSLYLLTLEITAPNWLETDWTNVVNCSLLRPEYCQCLTVTWNDDISSTDTFG